ncbi:MAG: T9SS type A sorting domain-containing protein [Saprospiraceae bacterium]|nr:T9SS type A sorting domain-containing protein [Saprospiraceae bacterium]
MKKTYFILSVLTLSLFQCFVSTDINAQNQKGLISDSIDILHYDINLNIVHLSKKTITGYTELEITPLMSGVSNISLDLLELTIDSIKVNNSLIPVFNYNDTLLGIPLGSSINQNDTIIVRVYYHGQPVIESYGWGGFHFSNDSSLAYNLGVAFVADPHNYGRVWYPCIDDFVDRATYDFHIRVKNDKVAVCNGMLQSETNNFDGTKSFHWKLEQSIPTYLASVAISNYAAVVDSYVGINGTIPTFLHVPPADTAKARASFTNLNSMMSIYENSFGPYSWSRVGFISTTQGAMEHATNIAIPSYMFNGNTSYETLFAHELSHHWFGDLITCATAEDMWINEGWAVYCEAIFMEGRYGNEAYKNYSRANHESVLQFAHTPNGDNSYLAVYGIPHEYTYGKTVYDKGASMVQSLRGYLGDSVFFSSVKAMVNQYSFKDISTIQMRDFLTTETGINMNDWFDAWILTPGFAHFSIDSFNVVSTPTPEYSVTVYVKQKLKGRTTYANSNKIEITFMDDSWNKFSSYIEFSGQTGSQTFVVPFNPSVVMLDIEERTLDATTDNYKIIKSTGVVEFLNTTFKLDVKQVTDSAFVRVTHNWVAPDPHKTPIAGLKISDYRYWTVEGIFPQGFNATGQFRYSKSNYLDNTLMTSNYDSLIILYRAGSWEEWQPISFTRTGSTVAGLIKVDNLKKGEYTLAMWDQSHLGIKKSKNQKLKLQISPNPSNGDFKFNTDYNENLQIKIYSSSGELVDSLLLPKGQQSIKWQAQDLNSGTYIVQILNSENLILAKDKIVILK